MKKYFNKLVKFTKHPLVASVLGFIVLGAGMYFAKKGTFGSQAQKGAELVSEGISDGGIL